MKYSFFFILPFFYCFESNTTSTEYDSMFYNIAINVSSKNPLKAVRVADSLFIHAENSKQEMKSLLLMAMVLEKQERRVEAITFALRSLKIAQEEEDYNSQANTYRFLSRQYRSIGFIDKGKFFNQKGLDVSTQIKDQALAIKFKTVSNLEFVEYEIENKNYGQAIEWLKLAALKLEKERDGQVKYFNLANCEEQLGRTYMAMGEKDKALVHYSKANFYINKSESGESLCAASIYNGLINIYLDSGKTDSVAIYLKKNLIIAEKGSNNIVKELVYKSATEYYKQLQVMDSFNLYVSKYELINSENVIKKRSMVNSAHNKLNEIPDCEPKDSFNIMATMLFCVLPSLGVYYKRKTFLPYLEHKIYSNKNKPTTIKFTEKTEKELLLKLKEFEESKAYLDVNMSFPKLVGKLNTNIKYLRQMLKAHKSSDYNTYINELRISYIVEKLKTNEDYLNYKISFLADECGFSSHSKFSTNFKRFTNQSPSVFINSLKNKSA
ncbi:helix-turn-helix domain-containing protein [Formosa sp. PL04]|uniref:helix-turn-helix domain-containing protein n=1 Tax=Formosa sp. PL04 TaxID=3081755 RepID=UPI0029812C44|nr:helix-turn-helix domain-containing protein [Formosa sp. PL04]MDW5289144.1 helix-turn-helix domain-containing protein [Formosa sp. PL04]